MSRIRLVNLLLAAVLGALPLFSQEPIEGPNVFGDLSYPKMMSIFESRRLAYQELAGEFAKFVSPDIATALGAPSYLIVIARITAVQRPNGSSDVTDFDVESRWTPTARNDKTLEVGNFRETVLDKSEPTEGSRYILGYSLDYGDSKTVFVPSAIDLQDPTQARLIGDMKQFFAIESAASESDFEPYLEALGSIPWIRDIAIHWLSESDVCNASPVCAQKSSTAIRRQLQSKRPNERMEASDWLVWIDSVSRNESAKKRYLDGLPVLPDSAIRQLLSSAIDDSNVYIADQAFERREMFDFYRSSRPGGCIQVVPALRKSAHWLPGTHDFSGAHELLPMNFPLQSGTACIRVEKPKNK